MGFSKLLGVVAMASIVSTPVMAAKQTAPVNPAASLAIAPMGKVRTSTKGRERNNLLGLPVLAILGIAAAAAAVIAVATSGGSDSP